MPPRKTRTFNQWQSMQKAKSNGKGEKKFFFPACQLERARVLGFLAKHLAAIKGNKGAKGTCRPQKNLVRAHVSSRVDNQSFQEVFCCMLLKKHS